MLSDRCLSVCRSVLSVTFVHSGQTVGRIKMKLGKQVGLGPGHNVLNSRPMFIIVIVISLEHCTGVRRYWFTQVQVKF